MATDRKIKAAEIIRDIRGGMNDSAIMEKYKLSVRGLQNLFKQILDARVMQPSELYGRCPNYDHWVMLENMRSVPRQPLFVPLPAHCLNNPQLKGNVEELTEHGLRLRNIETKINESFTLVLNADRFFVTDPIVVEATCKWTSRDGETATWVAGFAIDKVVEGDLKSLLALVHAFPFWGTRRLNDDSLSEYNAMAEDEEDSTETVDLANLFSTDVSTSGSFSFRGVSQTWFGKLLQALPIPALLLDQHLKIGFLNHSWITVSTAFKELHGKEFNELFPDPMAAEEARLVAETVFSTRKSMSSHSVLEVHGNRRWGRLHLRSVRMGLNRSILVLVEDLTLEREQLLLKQHHNERLLAEIAERKKAQEALLKAERLKAVGELASGVSHNFNNLLQIVQGNAQLALTDMDRGNLDHARAGLEQIISASELASGTVRRLQDFARVKPPNSGAESKVFNFSKMVKQASEMTKIWWKTVPEKAGIVIRLIGDHLDPLCMVKGREYELFEVVVNLIKNAAEALPEGGEIRIDTSVKDGNVILRVTDSGVGISPENVNRIFEPFFSTKDVRSSGMGLASSYGIVKSHGGTISVESNPGEGATFTVRIPLAEELPVGPAETPKPFDLHLRILVIDDMEPVTALLSSGLTEYGQTVVTALSGQEGLRLFEQEPTQVVICDLGMPGMNGWDVGLALMSLCQLKRIRKPPFIIVTGWRDQVEEKEEIARSGVDAVVHKPVDIPKLLETIRSLVEPRKIA